MRIFCFFVQIIVVSLNSCLTLAAALLAAACSDESVDLALRDPASSAVSSSLSSSHVTCFGEDATGHIWIGTNGGLNRYTGKEFYQYFRVEEPYALQNNYIRSFFTDSEGRFWIINDSGACWYNEEDAFTRADMDVTLRAATALAESPSGDIVMYSYAGELLVLDEAECIFRKVDFSTPIPQCRNLFASPGGTVFLVANNALYEVDYRTGTVLQQIPWPGISEPTSVYAVSDGKDRVFVYGEDYLCCYDLKQRCFVPLPAWLEGLKGEAISILYFKGDNTFVMTGKGLWYHDGSRLYAPDENSPYFLSDFSPSCLFLDSRGILWAGSSNKGYLTVPFGGTMFNNNRIWHHAFQDMPVSSVCPDGGDGLWALSEGHLYHLDAQGRLGRVSPTDAGDTYQDIAIGSGDGTVWIARHWDVFSFRYEDGRVSGLRKFALPRRINRLICSQDGKVYAGTYYRGLFEIDPATGFIRTLHQLDDDQLFGSAGSVFDLALLKSGEVAATMFQRDIEVFEPASGRVRTLAYRDQIRELFNLECLLEDHLGNIWFGTRDFGLYKIDTAGVCSLQEGLRSRAIRSLEQSPDGRIWVGTTHGLSMIDPENGLVLNYTASNGIGGNEFYSRSSCVLPDGTVILGGQHGITTCDYVPRADSLRSYPVVVEDIRINNEHVYPSENGSFSSLLWHHPTVRLKHNQNNLAVSFALLDYHPYVRSSFRFILEGHDKEWTRIGDATTIYFSRLRPGKFVLRVMGDLADDGVVEECSLPIRIRPPFWLTRFAKILYLLIFLAFTCLTIWYQRRKLKYEMRLEQAEREKAHEQEMNRMNLNFFGNLAHEFRSPLTLLEGPMAQLEASQSLTGQEHRILEVMGTSVKRMHRLVNQIIDYNKMDTGGLVLHAVRDYDLAAYLRHFVTVNEIAAKAQDVVIIPEGIDRPVCLPVDEEKMESILTNLSSNAFKFVRQEGGQVHFRLSEMPSEEVRRHMKPDAPMADKYITVNVENNGLPIDPSELEHVFDRYYQLRQHGENAKRVGSGIGLSFARTLAELHHGCLWAENLPDNSGVRFTLALPADESVYGQDEVEDARTAPEWADMPKIRVEVPEQEGMLLNRAKVMVVDDDIDIANYIAMILGDDYAVTVCYNAGQALEMLQSSKIPDIILSDVMMPGVDGIQLCKMVKSNSLTRRVPFILITAKTGVDFQVEGLESGADAYVAKPFDPSFIRAQVRSLLKNRVLASGEVSGLAESLQIDLASLSEGDRQFINDIGALVQKELASPDLDVTELARRMNMSRSKLFYRIKEITGMSPVDLIRRYRMEVAAQMLREGKGNVSEVAYAVGINSLSYFSKSFKQQFGILPKDVARK